VQELTNNPPKKQLASIGFDRRTYLKAAIRNLLVRADHEPNEKIAFEEHLARVRDLANRLRRDVGFAPWWSVGFASAACVVLLAMLIGSRPKGYVYSAPQDYFRIIEKIDDSRFVMQLVHEGRTQIPVVLHFCQDYTPKFEAGMTLQWFSYEDDGKCQSLAPKNRGYVLVRGADHRPLLAKNCQPDFVNDRVVCEGGKARFD